MVFTNPLRQVSHWLRKLGCRFFVERPRMLGQILMSSFIDMEFAFDGLRL